MEITVPILINSTHYVENTDSTYRYILPAGGITLNHGDTVSLTSVALYYSWFNISEENGNNKLSLIFDDIEHPITFPDGFYSIDTLNSYIQHFCIQNNLYLIDSNGNHVYYVHFSTNPSRYKVQLDCFVLPTTLPSGWTDPGGFPFPLTPITVRVIIPANMNKILGFTIGTYPPISDGNKYEVLGNLTPQLSPVQAILIRSNIISNGKYSNPTDLLATFTVNNNTSFGQLVEYEPNDYSFMTVQPGKYEYIEISFIDQVFRPIKLVDHDVTMMLLIKIQSK
jgi:hypothetical protein